MKKFASGKAALIRSVCQQEFCKFDPKIPFIPHLTLKL